MATAVVACRRTPTGSSRTRRERVDFVLPVDAVRPEFVSDASDAQVRERGQKADYCRY